MKPTILGKSTVFMLAGTLVLCLSATAQQSTQSNAQRLQSYDLRREVSLLGTVVKYETASSAAPMGAHLLLQTSSGQVDVHLGNAKVLQANHFELNPGDSVRIIGEELAFGGSPIFAARIVQKGAHAVAVRNTRGFLTTPAAGMSPSQAEALRGVR
jgi:DNA/RNA endonuclease YhcR with UshA esterase domain